MNTLQTMRGKSKKENQNELSKRVKQFKKKIGNTRTEWSWQPTEKIYIFFKKMKKKIKIKSG